MTSTRPLWKEAGRSSRQGWRFDVAGYLRSEEDPEERSGRVGQHTAMEGNLSGDGPARRGWLVEAADGPA